MKSHERERLVVGLVLLLSCLLQGCSKPAKVPSIPSEQEMEKFTSKVHVHIYVDATLSMLGFVKPGQNTRYCETIDALESTIISGWSQTDVTFFKFGDEIDSVRGREYIEAKELTFYSNEQINRFTRIQKVLNRVQDTDITLILTDLFQDKADVNLLMADLKEKCLTQRLAFGIIGIRSEFEGRIYDIGPDVPPVYYRSMPNQPDTYRPFYIMLIGKHVDVVHFYEHFKASDLDFIGNEFIVYSPYLVARPGSFTNAIIDSTSGLTEVLNLIPNRYEPRVKQFRIQGDPFMAVFQARVPFAPAAFTMPYDPAGINFEVSATQCFPDTLIENAQAAQALNFSVLQISGSELRIRAELRPLMLPEEGVYFYKIVLRPEQRAYQVPPWIREWDYAKSSSLTNGAGLITQQNFEGQSTLNLYGLLYGLWSTNLTIHQPHIATFYCMIQK